MNELAPAGGVGPGPTIPQYRDVGFDRPAARSPLPCQGIADIRVEALVDGILDGAEPVR
ncbi:hypothetical protein [uncultured Propionibacterium sp.]|uniref:hypothetical protein n=1 Tax=uncultured Propionibacterium sp. TaxID=218066 RepID=UPI00292D17CE|nr:hypothetical protein [uncultured Propionibacterium sp.]